MSFVRRKCWFLVYAFLGVVGVLKVLVGEHFWAGDLANGTPGQVWLILIFAAGIVAVFRRKWQHFTAMVAIGLAFIAFDFPYYFGPGEGPVDVPKGTLRVMQWNTHMLRDDCVLAAELVKKWQPDILTMQEADDYESKGPYLPKFQALLPDYHFAISGQNVIATRGEYARTHSWPLIHAFEVRQVLEAKIKVKGKLVNVATVHMVPQGFMLAVRGNLPIWENLPHFGPDHLDQARALCKRVAPTTILTGDFNHTNRGVAAKEFRNRWQDAFETAGRGWGLTIVPQLPFKRIDFILAPKVAQVRHCWTPKTLASDHLPVVADLHLASLP